jgi:alkylation response protein AidB-like acyl-CoA dehydrogenase
MADMTAIELDPAEFGETAGRAVLACAGLTPRQAAQRLAEDGLFGILAAEAHDGLGLDLRFAVPVATAAAKRLFSFPLTETMLLSAAFGGSEVGAAIMSGETLATIAWAGTVTRFGERVDGTVGRVPVATSSDLALVRTVDGAALVRLDDAGVRVSVPTGLDVDAPEHEITLSQVPVLATLTQDAHDRLRRDALLLHAAAILGSAEACLEAAIEHVSTRQQFGRPLVAFQALRHALAREKLGIEGIRAAITRSLMLDDDGAEAVLARRAAFAAAVQYGPGAVENALQLHGGMGFTWDVPMHRHLRRVRSWEMQSDAPAIRRALAGTLMDINT